MSESKNEDINEEEKNPQDVMLRAAELRYKLRIQTKSKSKESIETAKELLELIKEHSMVSLYETVWNENNKTPDPKLIEEMNSKKNDLLTKNSESTETAKKEEGDVEVLDSKLERAHILAKTSDLDTAINEYISVKGLTTGKDIDKYLAIQRLCLAYSNDQLYKTHSEETTNLKCEFSMSDLKLNRLIDKGGDWDRRNRFIVYNGIHNFRIRKFKESAQCFLDAIATFSANEIFDYKRLVEYTIIASVVSLDRVSIKSKIIDSPEVIQVINEIPILNEFLNSFYKCNYKIFLKSLIKVMFYIRNDFYLNIHSNFYLREMRYRIYNQFLSSYLSVELKSMSNEFGLSTDFLDEELSSFISSGKLNCKIDKVNGIIKINRIDNKNSKYEELLKKGDILLARIQRLNRILTY